MAARNITDVADIAKTGVDLVSPIEKYCDPNNENKTESVLGIVGNCLLFMSKTGNIITESFNEKTFKLQI